MTEQTDKKSRTAFASMSGGFLSSQRSEQGPNALRDLGAHLLRRIGSDPHETATLAATNLRAR